MEEVLLCSVILALMGCSNDAPGLAGGAGAQAGARVLVALLQPVVKPKPGVTPPLAGLLWAASLRPAGRARPAASRKPVGQ